MNPTADMKPSPGELILTARKAAGLTQAELGSLAKVSAPSISSYEVGDREPRIRTLRRILRAAGYELQLNMVEAT